MAHQTPNPDVEFSLIDQEWLLYVFLYHKSVGLDDRFLRLERRQFVWTFYDFKLHSILIKLINFGLITLLLEAFLLKALLII